MIEDTSVRSPTAPLWTDLSNGAAHHVRQSFSDRTLLVYQNIDRKSSEPAEMQLLTKARIVLPAVMNYLYFSSSQVAVVYFGKTIRNKRKYGIPVGAEDFKIRMIRFLTSEIWPPLLRTDAPDESLGKDFLTEPTLWVNADISPAERIQAAEEAKERSWFKKSVENNMQVLLYLKSGVENTKYLKVILNNTFNRLHFDVVDPKEEKYRWDLRMLYTRIMDNLETQKAIASYESYESSFRHACTMAADHAIDLERPHQAMVTAIMYCAGECHADGTNSSRSAILPAAMDAFSERDNNRASSSSSGLNTEIEDGGPLTGTNFTPNFARPTLAADGSMPDPTLVAPARQEPEGLPASSQCGARREVCPDRYYRWMESLEKPESATLDYKSYFSFPALEIRNRCVKFMCGFLNAYREGKIVIGVHEIPRRDSEGNLCSDKVSSGGGGIGGRNIVVHNDQVDQFVVGVRITAEQLDEMQADVSQQLLSCVPPIPPQTVRIDVVPVCFPFEFHYSKRILVLYDDSSAFNLSRDALKQKSNYIIRFLTPHGLAVIPLDLVDEQLRPLIVLGSGELHHGGLLKAQAFVIAAYRDPADLDDETWEASLSATLTHPKNSRCRYVFVDYPEADRGPLTVPPLSVVEVSVDIKRCGCPALLAYQGKFFNNWPSIPIWDPTTRSSRRVERNYRIFRNLPFAGIGESPTPVMRQLPISPLVCTHTSPLSHLLKKSVRVWFNNAQVAHTVLSFLYNPARINDILQFRRVHPMWSSVFENRQGTHLVRMIHSTPFGVPQFIKLEYISSVQYAFQQAGVPPMPLLLCRVYEIIGNLPSPYPFVAVPLTQQSFRVSSHLIPIFYRQRYFDGTLRLAVVLDLRDGILKTMDLRNGNLVLETVIGMCFERMNKRQVTRQLLDERSRATASSPADTFHSPLVTPPLSQQLSPYGDLKLTGSFLAPRRSLMPKTLRQKLLGSHLSSVVLSPIISDSKRLTQREVEPDIPLLHFRFLTKDMLRCRTFVVETRTLSLSPTTSCCGPSSIDDVSTEGGTEGVDGMQAWTLQHLLSWYNALFTDKERVRFFGYCDRSIAFHIQSLAQVCADDLEPGALDCACQGNVRFATSREDCILHQKVRDWMHV